MRLSLFVHFGALAVVFAGSLVLVRARMGAAEVLMAIGSGTALGVEAIAFASVMEVVPNSWLDSLGIGLPMGAGDLGWIVFAVAFLWFAFRRRRSRASA